VAEKKQPFGGKQAKPFGSKEEEKKDDKKPAKAKKSTAKK
jgi:hypothetical protein